MAADPLVRETQKLYGLPLSQFTAARNARAKALKQKGEEELAAAIAAVPKPSVAAGALNELVHEDPSEVRALVQSGKRLRQAQEAAVSGKKGADLNEAIKEHRVALERVQRDLRRRKLSAADARQGDADPARRVARPRSLAVARTRPAARGSDLVRLRHRPRARAGGAEEARRPKAAPPKQDKRAEERRRRAERKLADAEQALAEAQRGAERALKDVERATADVESARSALAELDYEGYFGSSRRSASTRTVATAWFRTQLRSAGITYQGACSVEVSVRACSYADVYSSKRRAVSLSFGLNFQRFVGSDRARRTAPAAPRRRRGGST